MSQAPVAQLVEHRGVSIPVVLGSSPSGRACRKCGNRIPWQARINGKVQSLQGRKFCLTCSPFGAHNTKVDDPSRPARGPKYSDWTKTRQRENAASVHKRGKRLREQLIKEAGGCCNRCTYKRCLRALEFHHKDPTTKLFNLSAANMRRYSLEEVLAEVAKCELVCANCHREIEDGLL